MICSIEKREPRHGSIGKDFCACAPRKPVQTADPKRDAFKSKQSTQQGVAAAFGVPARHGVSTIIGTAGSIRAGVVGAVATAPNHGLLMAPIRFHGALLRRTEYLFSRSIDLFCEVHMKASKTRTLQLATAAFAMSVGAVSYAAAENPMAVPNPQAVQIAQCNPCATKAAACNPCNPCAAKVVPPPNPCNPCAATNPCKAGAATNPCNPCAGKSN